MWIIINSFAFWPFCLTSSIVNFNNGPVYLTRGIIQVSAVELGFEKFFLLLMYSFSNFFPFISVWWFPLPLFPDICKFFSRSVLMLFLFCYFYFFNCFTFITFHYQHCTFFNAKFHSYMLAVYSYLFFIKVTNSFSVLANILISSMYVRWTIFFCKFVDPEYFLSI